MRRVPLLLLSLFSALSALVVLAEIAARRIITVPYLPSVLEKDPFHSVVMDSAPRGIQVPVRVTANRWGMRGEEPPRDWEGWETWVALGSSTTLCGHLDDARTWPARLQARLREGRAEVWVGNAGQDGVTAGSGVMLMDGVIARLRPDGVLALVGAGDMALSFHDDRRRRGSLHDQALRRRLASADWEGGWREVSPLLREREARRRLRQARTLVVEPTHRTWFPPPLAVPEDALPPLDVLLPSLPSFRENVLRMGDRARGLGARAVFLTHPGAYGTDSAWKAREARTLRIEGRDYRISAATERALLDRFNAVLLEACAFARLECFDLAARIPPDTAYFYDEGHFTDAGADRVAREVAAWLRR